MSGVLDEMSELFGKLDHDDAELEDKPDAQLELMISETTDLKSQLHAALKSLEREMTLLGAEETKLLKVPESRITH